MARYFKRLITLSYPIITYSANAESCYVGDDNNKYHIN